MLREWFGREVAMVRARNILQAAGAVPLTVGEPEPSNDHLLEAISGGLFLVRGECPAGVFDAEIARAARGEAHASVDDLWLAAAQRWLDDDQLARILCPAEHRRDREAAITNMRQRRMRVRRWIASVT